MEPTPMIEIVISACLMADLSRCKDVSLTYTAENLTPMQCMSMSMAEIAKWNAAHPNWFAKRWTCQPAGRMAKT
jgi:hypothetical protein